MAIALTMIALVSVGMYASKFGMELHPAIYVILVIGCMSAFTTLNLVPMWFIYVTIFITASLAASVFLRGR